VKVGTIDTVIRGNTKSACQPPKISHEVCVGLTITPKKRQLSKTHSYIYGCSSLTIDGGRMGERNIIP